MGRNLFGIACRSVHLAYRASEGVAFHNETRVLSSAPGTFFMVCGWQNGYFGIQELKNGAKVVLFSVWDSSQDNPDAVRPEDRVQVLDKDSQVRVARFANEGSGGQSFLDYEWKSGETDHFFVSAEILEDRTAYSGYFRAPQDDNWRHLITFSTIFGGAYLREYHSFIEDFKRDRVSTQKKRKALFCPSRITSSRGKGDILISPRRRRE